MKATTQKDFDAANDLDLRLDGIAAKVFVMAGSYSSGSTPTAELTEAALISIANEIKDAQAAFRALWRQADPESVAG